jgi:hypothetical protein
MSTKDGFNPDHRLPLFLCENAGELEQADIEQALDRAVISSRILKTGILVVTATAIGIAILSAGSPVVLFANVMASLVDTSASQPGTGQSTPTIQSTADADLPPIAKEAPTRDEIAIASEPADQTQSKISEPPAGALLKQFQAWAAEEDARALVVQPAQDAQAQDGSAQPVQDAPAPAVQEAPAPAVQEAPAQVVQDAPAQIRPMQKHRHVRRVQNARAEIRPARHPRAMVRREQNARAQVAPVQNPRAQDQPVQNAEAPSFLQSFGWRN